MTEQKPEIILPDLKGVATNDLVEKIGTGKYSATYINWSRTMQLLRENAPGWLPEIVPDIDGSICWHAPVGGYLMLRFWHVSGFKTPMVPQAIMDYKNNSIAYEKITSRDITDTERRGSCLLAAKQFGLAYELWAKMPLENPYRVADEEEINSLKDAVAKAPPLKMQQGSDEQVKPSEQKKDMRTTFMEALRGVGLMEELIVPYADKARDGKGYEVSLKSLYGFDENWAEEQNKKFRQKQEAAAY